VGFYFELGYLIPQDSILHQAYNSSCQPSFPNAKLLWQQPSLLSPAIHLQWICISLGAVCIYCTARMKIFS